jgi:mannose/fructose/N-acetylgalactosamine-specific phosphotransferase system component IID
MKKTLSLITITTFLSVIAIASAYAMNPKIRHANMSSGNYGCLNNLTPEEQTALKAQKAKYFNETKNLRTEIFNKQLAVEEEFNNSSPDSDKIKNLRNQIFELKQKMAQKRHAHME